MAEFDTGLGIINVEFRNRLQPPTTETRLKRWNISVGADDPFGNGVYRPPLNPTPGGTSGYGQGESERSRGSRSPEKGSGGTEPAG
ncbi:MAG: hypothetical protein US60_C0041G0012 [Microgenomates group bacterium GW2011_GWC1_37_8]|uniref:Uncharacterized protein n=1 Tax=Candidatus Woesebacteria bacterium GW2011_GWB1_38_8 TaxID=1618570 RepID=A0A0G0KXV8_9BACT|nr:MAG: hypothetical protein US60_C0041G0012 [Microgenomates group bacterium GW2011_GWC1_37_8]KKQ84463.1 MAG: hypothetical protein UT08_C0018G0069 [Candidatus Woesebacteria bacterium GW2011_GWB1_38_8]